MTQPSGTTPPSTGGPSGPGALSRRGFLKSGAATGAGAVLSGATQALAQDAPASGIDAVAVARVPISARINGVAVEAEVEPALDLLAFLRERRGLTGTKVGCNHGQCGACTVHLDGERVNACLLLAAKIDGREVTTIEGLAALAETDGSATDGLHPLQAAFIEHDGQQCGYCTPGQIMSGAALMAAEGGIPDDDAAMKDAMSGNVCRCAAYPGIQAAMRSVRDGTSDPTDGGRRGPLTTVAAPAAARG